MGENSKISWTDHTFNPWIGCTHVSEGCRFCYAEELMDQRYGRVEWGARGSRSRTKTWGDPVKWDRQAAASGTPARVFCASLADVFDDHASIDPQWRSDLWGLVEKTPDLIWLLLTKRPGNWFMLPNVREPITNVRLGVTIEDDDALVQRAPFIQAAATWGWPIFISYEPALGPVNWSRLGRDHGISQIICGQESGTHRRPFERDWARATRDWCKDGQDVAFFHKQEIDERGRKIELPELDGRQWAEFPA